MGAIIRMTRGVVIHGIGESKVTEEEFNAFAGGIRDHMRENEVVCTTIFNLSARM